ncbi:uncharacterized protein LOC122524765 isoform X1 [Polistes fuscatus]|uniref:uncharacterized protein LOC122524765 isoform X1 n=1 Tax=Polistes fuscatus TaxID=30207 RepID=UPI001CA96885|nr:uncharacterized protein LOC122524765 isoform X1 [Polistes fuscatus]
MMNTPTREFLRRPDGSRRRSARQALAVIPNIPGMTLSPGEVLSIEQNNMDNVINSRHTSDSCSPAPSPDELVIQKRGRRRRTIVWSPDLDACKRDSLLSLSFKDRTPVKSPIKATVLLRSTPRKRLSLGDETRFSLSEKKKRTPSKSTNLIDTSVQKKFNGNLVNGLRGLSHDQLVKLITDVISMQESGTLREDDKLRDVFMNKIPMADIQPLREKLCNLRQNVFASLVSSNTDDCAYSRAYIHLEAFQKAVIDQGRILLDSQHWSSLMQYVFAAWNIIKELPEWESQGLDNTTCKCFKNLAILCTRALMEGRFNLPMLNLYRERFEAMAKDCEEINACLQLLKDSNPVIV